jgi:acetyl esterase/lipase
LPLRRSALAALLALAGCSPARLLNATVSTRDVLIERDLAYGDGAQRRLDVYRPRAAPAGPAPVVIFVHGGRWRFGAKGDYLFVGQALAAAGLVAVIPDHRHFPEATWRGPIDDAEAATRWAFREAGRFGGDPGRVFLAGHSSGAHAAAMVAVDPGRLAGERAGLRGLVGIAGPYDFLPARDPDVREVFAGAESAEAQPVGVAGPGAPPTLLLHGLDDEVVRPRNSEALAARLRELGTPVELRLYPGVGHIDIVAALSTTLRGRAPTFADLNAFVRRVAAEPAAPAAAGTSR